MRVAGDTIVSTQEQTIKGLGLEVQRDGNSGTVIQLYFRRTQRTGHTHN